MIQETEHPAVLAAAEVLAEDGVEVTALPVDSEGLVDPASLARALRPDTVLVSIMHANNETGAIQPISALSRIARDAGVLFHTDAAQSVGKVPVDVDALGVDAERALVEMPYVHPDGRVDYGHRAFASILRTGPLPWRVVGRLMTTRAVDPVARSAYHWVAANRSRLPGGTAACAIEP